jgi:hypothetical protein
MSKLLAWLKSHEPQLCDICGRFAFRKDMRVETASNGYPVRMCSKCHKEIFNPFSEEE